MERKEIKKEILRHDEESFIDWYNNSIIDPFSEFAWCTIRHNTRETETEILQEIDLEKLIELSRNRSTKYDADDKYIMFGPDEIFTFNTVSELMSNRKLGNGILDYIEIYEDAIEDLKQLD